jgi:uncharacterized membrane protein YesL
MPAAVAATYAAVGGLIRPSEGEIFTRLWAAFRRSFWTATLLGLVTALVGWIFWLEVQFFWQMASPMGKFLTGIALIKLTLLAMVNLYAWPLLAWYPQPLGSLLRRSFLLTGAHPFWALGGLLSIILWALMFQILPGLVKGLILLIGPGGVALTTGLAAWQAMKRYESEAK